MLKRRTHRQRLADRAAGVDRFGRPLPRTIAANPRAAGAASPPAKVGAAPAPVFTTRAAARAVFCPRCRALPGHPCTGSRQSRRVACHAARHRAAIGNGARVVVDYRP